MTAFQMSKLKECHFTLTSCIFRTKRDF